LVFPYLYIGCACWALVNLIFWWPCIIMYHNKATNLIHFHFHFHYHKQFIVSYSSTSLHVSGVKRPSSGGTALAVFGVSCVHLYTRSAFLKLWSADHKWSSGSALVVLLDWTLVQKKTKKIKLTWTAYHTL
jgi:hypothetical protein